MVQAEESQVQGAPVLQGRSFRVRALAYVVDLVFLNVSMLLVGVPVLLLVTVVASLLTGTVYTVDESAWSCPSILLSLLLGIVYFVALETTHGSSLGKVLFGLRVVLADGTPCSLKASTVRSIVRFIDSLFLGVPAYLSMKAPMYQRIGDRAANTIVVGSKDPGIRTRRSPRHFILGLLIYVAATAALLGLLSLGTLMPDPAHANTLP